MFTLMKTSRSLFVILSATAAAAALAQTTTTVTVATPANTSGAVTTTVAVPTPPPVVTVTSNTPRPVGIVSTPAATGETVISLDIGHGIRPVPASRVTVPVGETLRILGPNTGGKPCQWLKNGAPLVGATTNPLVLPYVTSADAGTYSVFTVDPLALALTAPSQSLVLGVGQTDRLLNLSTRANVGAGADQGLVSGFVVGGGAREKKLILRAIGPSLALFGVGGTLRAPVLRIYDGNGRLYENGYAYPAVVGGLTYEADLAASLAGTGAFPIPEGTRDVVVMMPFAPGSYTAQVTSGDGTSGNVLLEIYEVP